MKTSSDAGDTTGRRKLWQFDPACRDDLIGICLTPRELKELCGKLRIEVASTGAEAYRRALAGSAGEPSPGARRLHKYLDRKYWHTILRFTAATSAAALEALWHEAGDARGACWALATHPQASAGLRERVRGELRDRVQPNGHAIRVDDRTLRHLQRANVAFARQRGTAAPVVPVWKAADAGRSTQTMPEYPAPAQPHPAVQEMESLLLSLRTQIEDYAAKLALERVRAEHAEASAREWRELAIRYEARHRRRDAMTGATVRRMQPPRRQTGSNAAIHGTG